MDRLRRSYEVFNSVEAEDWDAWDQFLEEFYDPDVVAEETPQFPGLREYRGYEGMRLWAKQGSELFETLEFEPQEFIEAGEVVVVPVRISGRSRSGAEVERSMFHVVTFKGGRIMRLRGFDSKQQALEAAGLSE